MFKKLVQMGIQKVTGKGKVSPTIKSVKPNLTKSVKQTKTDEYRKRYTALDKSESKIKTGKKKGETVFYASKNKGVIKGVDKTKKRSKNAKT